MRNLAGCTLVFFKLRKGIDRASISTTARSNWLSRLATATVPASNEDTFLTSAVVSIQQFRKPLSDLSQGQPQSPKQEPRKRLSITALVVVVAIVAAFIVAAFGFASHLVSTSRPITQATPASSQLTTESTLAPALQATSQSTKRALPAPAIIGSDSAQFVIRYGQPNDHSIPSSGYYHFRRYTNSDLDFLIVQTDVVDGGIYVQRVKGVMVQAPGTGWNQQQADAACAAFLPSDSVLQRTVKLATGYDKVYFSATLAGLFLASAFTDPNGNQVKAGLFDVHYIYRSGTIIDSCDILIETQQTQL
jgi:hypothetical protein